MYLDLGYICNVFRQEMDRNVKKLRDELSSATNTERSSFEAEKKASLESQHKKVGNKKGREKWGTWGVYYSY